nr:twin-arginine translocase TatA/TatE family subunit [Deltaproteobacteria bacterium]
MGLGATELIVILLIVVLLFGASKIPELGKSVGQGIKSFKDGLRQDDPPPPPPPPPPRPGATWRRAARPRRSLRRAGKSRRPPAARNELCNSVTL